MTMNRQASSFGLIGDVETALRLEERAQSRCVNCWEPEEMDEAIDDDCSVLIIDARKEPSMALSLARRASTAGRTVAMLGQQSLLPRALDAGCKELLDDTRNPQRLAEFLARNKVEAPRASLTVCIGAHAGAGGTMASIAMASNLLDKGRVCLLDLNHERPGIASTLHMRAGVEAHTLARTVSRMSGAQIRQTATPFGGLHVFSATNAAVEDDALPSLLDGLRRSFDHVVVDFGTQRYRHFRRVAHEATDILVIGDHDRIALLPTGTVSLIRQLDLMGVDRSRTHVVVNRFSRWRRPRVDTIGRVLGLPVSLALPVGQVHRFAVEFSSLDCRMHLEPSAAEA